MSEEKNPKIYLFIIINLLFIYYIYIYLFILKSRKNRDVKKSRDIR